LTLSVSMRLWEVAWPSPLPARARPLALAADPCHPQAVKRIGEPWTPSRHYRDRIGVYALVPGRDGRLLCVHRVAEGKAEMQLPGGGVDTGEHTLAALHREVREETGWIIGGPRHFASFQSYTWLWTDHYWARKVHLIYRARAIHPLGPPEEPGHTVHWLAPEAAARLLDVPGDREMVRRAVARGLI
jgi:8-oxo-dGTP diphosphatase